MELFPYVVDNPTRTDGKEKYLALLGGPLSDSAFRLLEQELVLMRERTLLSHLVGAYSHEIALQIEQLPNVGDVGVISDDLFVIAYASSDPGAWAETYEAIIAIVIDTIRFEIDTIHDLNKVIVVSP